MSKYQLHVILIQFMCQINLYMSYFNKFMCQNITLHVILRNLYVRFKITCHFNHCQNLFYMSYLLYLCVK